MNFIFKTGVVSLLLLLMASCVTYRNDQGRKRFICCKFTMKRNTNNAVYKIIDTTKLYELVAVLNIQDSTYLEEFNKSFLKFYADGKIGRFYTYDKNDTNALNPKKAAMGVYNYNKGILRIQTYFYHVQGGGFLKYRLKKSTTDFLEFGTAETSWKYTKIDIPKEQLIYTPDW